jgi:DNA-directed RNA polymerase specialized sigma24 family protein
MERLEPEPAVARPARPPAPAWRALVDRCRSGDDPAWEVFLAAFNALAQRRLRRHFPHLGPSDRADVVSAALERLIVAVRSGQIRGRTDAEVGAYVGRALRNHALDFIGRRRPESSFDEAIHHQTAQEGGAYQRALVQKIMEIVGSWPAAERFVFVQKWHGVPSERIKQELEQSPYSEFVDVATVDTRYLRLRGRLRSLLGC